MTSNEQRYLLLQPESAKTNLEKGLTAFEIDTNVSRHYPFSIYFPSSSSLSSNALLSNNTTEKCNITFRHYFHGLYAIRACSTKRFENMYVEKLRAIIEIHNFISLAYISWEFVEFLVFLNFTKNLLADALISTRIYFHRFIAIKKMEDLN